MAQLVNGNQMGDWAGQTRYVYLTGDVTRSGNTVTLSNLRYHFTAAYAVAYDQPEHIYIQSSGGDGTFSDTYIRWTFSGGTSPTVTLNNASFGVGTTTTSVTLRLASSDGSWTTFSISFPSGGHAPTAPTVSATTVSATQINVSWGTTDIGDPAGTVVLKGGTSSTPTTQLASKTTTGQTTYNHTGLTANTRYYYKATASNSIGSADSSTVSAYTKPAGITSITTTQITPTTATVSIVCASSGNALTTNLQISSNNTSWTNTGRTNVQGTTQTYTITGLTPNTPTTRYFRITTTAGSSASVSVSFNTLTDVKMYGSVNNRSKQIRKLYGSVNGRTRKIVKVYGSVNGRTKLIYRA